MLAKSSKMDVKREILPGHGRPDATEISADPALDRAGGLSLTISLALSLFVILMTSTIFAGLMIYSYAVTKVRTEMNAAILVGARIAHNAVDDVEEVTKPDVRIRLLVRDFDGDRHLRAILTDPQGNLLEISRATPPEEPAPRWLYEMFSGTPPAVNIPLPAVFHGHGIVRLQADPHNEIAEVWQEIKLTFLILIVFFCLVLATVYVTLGRALRPLRDLSSALHLVSRGDYRQRIALRGPRELRRLYQSFNGMAARLDRSEAHALALQRQLQSVQDEERAEVARDLHDEMGPMLFAADADITSIKQLIGRQAYTKLPGHVESAIDAIGRAKKMLRSVLQRLRPQSLLDQGLRHALAELVFFWTGRGSGLVLSLGTIERDSYGTDVDLIIYRVVQEGLNNAIRHGQPGHISIRIDDHERGIDIIVEDDGQGLQGRQVTTGFGLNAMRERVSTKSGSVAIHDRRDRRGACLRVFLPVAALTASTEESPAPALRRTS